MSLRSVIKKLIPASLFGVIEPYGHWAEAIIENIVFGFPARKLKVIGVTGTAGKTTICTLTTHMSLKQSPYSLIMINNKDFGIV